MITKKLSLYRTEHEVPFYREINSEAAALEAMEDAHRQNLDIFILGNGSNTFFENRVVRSAVLKNSLPRKIEPLEGQRVRISSSVLVSEVLKYCYEQQLDCFYFLASVPAEVGGALAMNAGQGLAYGGASIMDFVEEVRYIKDGTVHVDKPENLSVSYRRTIFTGQTDMFILDGVFVFPKCDPFVENPIKSRIEWAKKSQDLSKPNCGTVFKTVNMKILNRFRGLSLLGATYSRKTNNWIINESNSPLGIKTLLYLVIFFHKITFQKCETEIIRVK